MSTSAGLNLATSFRGGGNPWGLFEPRAGKQTLKPVSCCGAGRSTSLEPGRSDRMGRPPGCNGGVPRNLAVPQVVPQVPRR